MKKVLILASVLILALWSIPAAAEDCIDIDLGAELVDGNLSLYFFALNCGTEPGLATFTATLEKDSEILGSCERAFFMPAGVPFIKELVLPLPDIIPPGTYTLCITAVLGEASDTECASIKLDGANKVTSFEKAAAAPDEENSSWGKIKKIYR